MGVPSQMFVEGIRSTETQNKQPRLSVIVPAYNVESHLDKCLRSICEQSFTDFEVILVNDGSTDNTLAICEAWAERDKRIRFFSQENKGQAFIRNFGLREARADLIMFVDSDDFLAEGAIQKLMELKEKKKVQISMGRFCSVQEDGTSREHQHKQLGNCVMSGRQAYLKALYDRELQSYCWAKIFDKELFDGLAYPDGEYMEDYRLNYLVYLRAHRIAHTDQIVYNYFINPMSTLNDVNRRETANLKYLEVFYERYNHAKNTNLLSRREFILFHIKSIRSLIREIWRKRLPNHRRQTPLEYEKTLETLSKICGKTIREEDLRPLWRKTRRKKVFVTLFVWF